MIDRFLNDDELGMMSEEGGDSKNDDELQIELFGK